MILNDAYIHMLNWGGPLRESKFDTPFNPKTGMKQIEQFKDIILRIFRFLAESSGFTCWSSFNAFPILNEVSTGTIGRDCIPTPKTPQLRWRGVATDWWMLPWWCCIAIAALELGNGDSWYHTCAFRFHFWAGRSIFVFLVEWNYTALHHESRELATVSASLAEISKASKHLHNDLARAIEALEQKKSGPEGQLKSGFERASLLCSNSLFLLLN